MRSIAILFFAISAKRYAWKLKSIRHFLLSALRDVSDLLEHLVTSTFTLLSFTSLKTFLNGELVSTSLDSAVI